MNTFLNIHIEFPAGHPDRAEYLHALQTDFTLTRRIYLRGLREQGYACNVPGNLKRYSKHAPTIGNKRYRICY